MTGPVLSTAFATLDCAQARSILEDARSDPRKFREALTDCFFDGSAAASEAAAIFVLSITDSSITAVSVSDILKSLPTAIPPRNAPALAQVCSFLASSFRDEECRAPLNTFCYAESRVKQIAIKAVVSRIEETARLRSERLNDVLHQTRAFFTEVFRGGDNVHDRLVAVRGLVGIGSIHPGHTREAILSFLLELGSDEAPVGTNAENSPFEHEYESFLASELVAMGTDDQSLAKIVSRCLVRALDSAVASTVLELWLAQNSKVNMAVPLIGYDVFLYTLTAIAATNACRGRLSVCRNVLLIVTATLLNSRTSAFGVNEVICSIIASMCVAIGSMCSTAGAQDVAKSAASICKMLRDSDASMRAGSLDATRNSFQRLCHEATYWNCEDAALSLGLLQKLLSLWDQPNNLKSFIEGSLTDVLESERFEDLQEDQDSLTVGKGVTDSISRDAPLGGSQDTGFLPLGSDEKISSLLLITSIVLAGLSHSQPRVRYTAAEAITRIRSGPSLLFFLPAMITRLQEETSGVVVTFCLQDVLLSPYFLSHQAMSKVVMNTVLQLVRPSKETNASAAYQSGLVAIAGAAKTAPGLATSVLLAEVERLKGSFSLIGSATKAAACAAILKITNLRPARGASFVPFIMQCTTRESMESAPEATALCFDVISVMADKEVLDAVKAVKVVLKTFPDVLEVDAAARRSYLRLLGFVAHRSSSKKGAIIAGRVIGLLRNCLVTLFPSQDRLGSGNIEAQLSRGQVVEAARALAKYNGDEILRIAHANEEPLENPDEEKVRLEGIANECMQFMHGLLSATGKAPPVKNSAACGLRKLLATIAKNEWDSRQRSSFDPERIAKLRSTSEALRRARQKTQTATAREANLSAAVAAEERPTAQFLRAVSTLPAGVIKALCERCVPAKNTIAKDGDVIPNYARAISMRVLLQAGALSPAFPWVGLVEDMLESSSSIAQERAAGLAVLTHVDDDSFEANQSRAKWFGRSCAVFDRSERIAAEEAKELFIGMMMHQGAEVQRMLRHLQDMANVETLLVFIDATKEVKSTAAGFFAAVQGILEGICSERLAKQSEVEVRFYEACLKQLDSQALQQLLQPRLEAGLPEVAMRLVCLTGDYVLLRACANTLALSPAFAVDDATVHSLGVALHNLPAEQRRAVLQDLCAAGPGTSGEIKQTLAAHCLGTAALLPDVETSLRVATSVCKGSDSEKVRAIVARLVDDTRR